MSVQFLRNVNPSPGQPPKIAFGVSVLPAAGGVAAAGVAAASAFVLIFGDAGFCVAGGAAFWACFFSQFARVASDISAKMASACCERSLSRADVDSEARAPEPSARIEKARQANVNIRMARPSNRWCRRSWLWLRRRRLAFRQRRRDDSGHVGDFRAICEGALRQHDTVPLALIDMPPQHIQRLKIGRA